MKPFLQIFFVDKYMIFDFIHKRHNVSLTRVRKLTFVVAFMWLANGLQAQNGYNMPFSQYGMSYSDLPNGIGFADAYGGTVYTFSGRNFINPFNPASYGSIEKESFLFDISLNLNTNKLSNNNMSTHSFDGNLSYLSFAFPILDWWKTAIGVLPYNITNYESIVVEPMASTGQEVKNIFSGSGSVTEIYWGHSFNIIGGTDDSKARLQAGFNINYLFGKNTYSISYDFMASDTNFFQDTRRQKITRVNNFILDLGLQYRQPLGEKYHLAIGLTCKLPKTMNIEDNAMIYTYYTQSATEYIIDTIFPARGASCDYESTLEQPLTIGLGIALERNNLWSVAVDATYAPYSGMKYTEGINTNILGESGLKYNDNYRLAIGGGWMGDLSSSSYIKRIGLTGGVHYNKGKLCIEAGNEDWRLDEWGVGMGLTFPMRKGRSKLMLTCAYNNYGTTDLLRSECWTFGLTLSSNERWFMKRKYN